MFKKDEAKEAANAVISENPFLRRYPPNIRYTLTGFKNQPAKEQTYEVFGDSITDKESYRLNLVSMRGEMSQLSGSSSKGVYMFEDGKYNKFKDFSYVLRKDVSIVEIDSYIERLKKELELADSDLQLKIQEELSKAEEMKKEKVEQTKESSEKKEE